MAVRGDLPNMSAEHVRRALSDWVARNAAAMDVFRETVHPSNDPNDDYSVVYEAVFEPPSLDRARLELWVTDEGCVAVGLETRARMARRLGVRNRREGFGAGHEPHSMSERGLLNLLEVVAGGRIALAAYVIPWIGLGPMPGVASFQAVVPTEALKTLSASGYAPLDWLRAANEREFAAAERLLHFRAW